MSNFICNFKRCLESGDPITRSVVTSVLFVPLNRAKETRLTVKVSSHCLGELCINGLNTSLSFCHATFAAQLRFVDFIIKVFHLIALFR